jgi:tetratricopeptide (TPR) repeat protein
MKHGAARFRAFGNMADVLMKMEQVDEAVAIFQKQLALSKQSRDKRFEASAYGSLGVCHRLSKQYDKSLGYHTQVIEPP